MSKSLFQSELIRAGAGTGKTYQLIEKIYHLFEKSLAIQKPVPRLIVCTFTRKASQELKERLFEKSLESLSFSLSKPSLTNSFLDYISSSSLQIGTIDSILYHLLKKYGQEMELNPDFEVSSEPLNSKLFDSFSDEFLYKQHFSLLKRIPYPHLKDLLLSYYKYRLNYKQLSFYNEEDFKDFQKERDFFNFQKTQEQKKQDKINNLSIKERFKSLSQDLDYESMKKNFKEEEIFKSQNFLPLFQEFQTVAEEFFIEFLKRKKNSLFLTVEDLLLFAYHLLDSQPELSKKINQEWDYWLIDEYQDTSLLQDQVIEKITRFKNVFCVGDPGQSIYAFRGADPEVFKNREKKLINTGGDFKELKINRRSSPSLISFYNDFFPEEQFIKFEPAIKLEPDQKKELEQDSEHKKSCLSFFTYDLEEKAVILPALLEYIKKLQQEQGAVYSDIAILCSKNRDLIEIANYLKEKGIPLMVYGSKTISKNRVVLDSLFLLKFLINPYDNNNLKALLRTPYFRLSDQELANSSHEYNKLNKKIFIEFESSDESSFESKNYQDEKTTRPDHSTHSIPSTRHFRESGNLNNSQKIESYKSSFWAFIKDKYKTHCFVESLSSHLESYRRIGLFESWKQALFDSGIMDLADFQDPMGSSSASLWKLMSLLKKSKKSPLDLFYDLTERRLEDQIFEEPPVQANSQFMELMTIHKSKGLQFKHVIVLDFSMGKAVLESNQSEAGHSIYDPLRKKMSFSVPLGVRDKKKIKAYGHQIYNKLKREDRIREKDNLFYVAMTRAEESLALFIPQRKKPQKNSWLNRMTYFQKIENLLDEKEKGLWFLNSGVYDRDQYLLTVKNCQELLLERNSERNLENQQLQEEGRKSFSQALTGETNIENSKPGRSFKMRGSESLKNKQEKEKDQEFKESLEDQLREANLKNTKISTSFEKIGVKNIRDREKNENFKRSFKKSNSDQSERNKKVQTKNTAFLFRSSMDFIEYKQSFHSEKRVEDHLERSAPLTGAIGEEDKLEMSSRTKEDKIESSQIMNSMETKDKTEFMDTVGTSKGKIKISQIMKSVRNEKEDSKFFRSRNHIKNILLKTGVGTQLHFFLEKLFYFSPEELENLIENQDEKTKALIRPAINYILSLKEPNLSSFFKKGFSEWSFKFKKENLILQGQIDLWNQLDSVIHVIDYKSSSPHKKGFNPTRTQLIFYSWVLNEIYHPDQIFMYECYPLNKTIRKTKFQSEDKKDLDLWISEVLKKNKL